MSGETTSYTDLGGRRHGAAQAANPATIATEQRCSNAAAVAAAAEPAAADDELASVAVAAAAAAAAADARRRATHVAAGGARQGCTGALTEAIASPTCRRS